MRFFNGKCWKKMEIFGAKRKFWERAHLSVAGKENQQDVNFLQKQNSEVLASDKTENQKHLP